MAISFLEVRTDRHDFEILIWKHVGTQIISIQSSKLGASYRSLYASPDDGDAQLEECQYQIIKPIKLQLTVYKQEIKKVIQIQFNSS